MTTQELFEQMQGLWNEFSDEHSKTSKAEGGMTPLFLFKI